MTQQQIADVLGISCSTVQRRLAAMRQQGEAQAAAMQMKFHQQKQWPVLRQTQWPRAESNMLSS
jgi:transposase